MTARKYELTDETTTERTDQGKGDRVTLYRIRAMRSFGDVKAGDLGGFVQSTKNLKHTGNCWVYDNAKVGEDAVVSDDAQVRNNAKVFGVSQLRDKATASDDCELWGDTTVANSDGVSGRARLAGRDANGKNIVPCRTINQKLEQASRLGNNEDVKAALDNGARVQVNSNTPVCMAAARGHMSTVRLLLERGAELNDAKLFKSVYTSGQAEVAKELINRGLDIAPWAEKALVDCAKRNNWETLAAIIDAGGAAVDLENSWALTAAAKNNHVESVKVMLDRGAPVHYNNYEPVKKTFGAAKAKESFEAMIHHRRVTKQNRQVMTLWASRGMRHTHWIPESVIYELDKQPLKMTLVWAARNSDLNLVKTCLKAGTDPRARHSQALTWAADYDNPWANNSDREAIIDVLLDAGAEIDKALERIKTDQGRKILGSRKPKKPIFQDKTQAMPESLFF